MSNLAEQRLVRYYRNALNQCAANFDNDISTFQHAAAKSPFFSDSAITRQLLMHKQRHPRLRLLTLNLTQAYHKIGNVGDHLRAMNAIYAVDPPLVFAPSSAARVIAEAAAGVGALLDATIEVEERILRASGDLLDSFQQTVNAARKVTANIAPDAVARADRQLDALVTVIRRAGMEVVRQENGRPKQIRWVGDQRYRGIPNYKIVDLIEKAFPAYPALYQMGSGVAHSMEWMLGDRARIPADGPPRLTYTSDPYSNGAAATVTIAAVEFLITEYGRYMGHDPEHVVVAHRRRREALDRYMNEYAIERLRATGRP